MVSNAGRFCTSRRDADMHRSRRHVRQFSAGSQWVQDGFASACLDSSQDPELVPVGGHHLRIMSTPCDAWRLSRKVAGCVAGPAFWNSRFGRPIPAATYATYVRAGPARCTKDRPGRGESPMRRRRETLHRGPAGVRCPGIPFRRRELPRTWPPGWICHTGASTMAAPRRRAWIRAGEGSATEGDLSEEPISEPRQGVAGREPELRWFAFRAPGPIFRRGQMNSFNRKSRMTPCANRRIRAP